MITRKVLGEMMSINGLKINPPLIVAPKCPTCGVRMVQRASTKPEHIHRGPFYGCSDFPQCRCTLPIVVGDAMIEEERKGMKERVEQELIHAQQLSVNKAKSIDDDFMDFLIHM